jgi:hypothetical protein
VLARQIAETHGAALTLENKQRTHGCIASFSVPLLDGDGMRR